MPTDLRSDTVTTPTPAMRAAMANAEVGDDVLDGDPTVARLQERVCTLLGMERALFFPSGTMANQAALWLQGKRGTEVLLDGDAHIIQWEMAAAAAICGLQVRPVRGNDVVMDADALRQAIRPRSIHAPAASIVCVENTHNGAGGRVTSVAALRDIAAVAREQDLPVHMDGARLWNAAAATSTPLSEFTASVDTVMVSFSKGLGAPVGAALAGSAAAMSDAWSVRKRLGGGMRQSGILAAAALHALDHHLARLADDHAKARRLAERLDGVGGARVVKPETNIVMVDLPAGHDAPGLVAAAAQRGVLLSPWSAKRIRAVTHLDVSESEVEQAAEIVAALLEARPSA